MTTPRSFQTATVILGDYVLVAGGAVAPADHSAEIYNVRYGTWIAAPSMLIGRSFHAATALTSDRVLVVGGSSDAAATSAEVFSASKWTWISAGGPKVPRHDGHTASVLADGVALIAGGDVVFDINPVTSAEFYNPYYNVWSSAGYMKSSRSSHTATVLGNGNVLVAGGYGSSSESSELYIPCPPTAYCGPARTQ